LTFKQENLFLNIEHKRRTTNNAICFVTKIKNQLRLAAAGIFMGRRHIAQHLWSILPPQNSPIYDFPTVVEIRSNILQVSERHVVSSVKFVDFAINHLEYFAALDLRLRR
jgi:hypothetical protein